MTDTDTGARRAARADLCAGGTFVALGGAFAIGALNYDLGTAFQMGPGYVPLTLGCALAALGALVLGHGVLVALGHRNSPLKALVIAVGLTVLCLVIFVALLQLRLPLLGEWLGG